MERKLRIMEWLYGWASSNNLFTEQHELLRENCKLNWHLSLYLFQSSEFRSASHKEIELNWTSIFKTRARILFSVKTYEVVIIYNISTYHLLLCPNLDRLHFSTIFYYNNPRNRGKPSCLVPSCHHKISCSQKNRASNDWFHQTLESFHALQLFPHPTWSHSRSASLKV